jgi:hypothetical protein
LAAGETAATLVFVAWGDGQDQLDGYDRTEAHTLWAKCASFAMCRSPGSFEAFDAHAWNAAALAKSSHCKNKIP